MTCAQPLKEEKREEQIIVRNAIQRFTATSGKAGLYSSAGYGKTPGSYRGTEDSYQGIALAIPTIFTITFPSEALHRPNSSGTNANPVRNARRIQSDPPRRKRALLPRLRARSWQ